MIRRIGSELVYIGWQSAIEIVATLSGRRLDRTLKVVGSAGPGLPPLAASAGEKKKPPPDWTVRRFRSQDGVSLIGLSARVSVSLSDVARPPLCRASLQGVTPHSGYRSDVWGRFFPPE